VNRTETPREIDTRRNLEALLALLDAESLPRAERVLGAILADQADRAEAA
jgi:hypothetical protein